MCDYYGVEDGVGDSFSVLLGSVFCNFFFNVSLCLKPSLLGRLVLSRNNGVL